METNAVIDGLLKAEQHIAGLQKTCRKVLQKWHESEAQERGTRLMADYDLALQALNEAVINLRKRLSAPPVEAGVSRSARQFEPCREPIEVFAFLNGGYNLLAKYGVDYEWRSGQAYLMARGCSQIRDLIRCGVLTGSVEGYLKMLDDYIGECGPDRLAKKRKKDGRHRDAATPSAPSASPREETYSQEGGAE